MHFGQSNQPTDGPANKPQSNQQNQPTNKQTKQPTNMHLRSLSYLDATKTGKRVCRNSLRSRIASSKDRVQTLENLSIAPI